MNQVQQINYRIKSQTFFEFVRFIVTPSGDESYYKTDLDRLHILDETTLI
jgi:hypothetical protein